MVTAIRKKDRGSAIVEFAVILPLLALILCGIIEYGFMFYLQISLTNASREGARAGITRIDGSATTLAVSVSTNYLKAARIMPEEMPPGGYETEISAEISPPNEATGEPSTLIVSIVHKYESIVGLIPTPETLTAVAVMRRAL